MNWYIKIANEQLRVTRNGGRFDAYLGDLHVGQAFIEGYSGGHYLLQAIDVEPEYQRRGYGTQLIKAISDYLHSVGATLLSSSNEGSGTVQMLDKVFGRDKVKHYHGRREVPFEEAKKIMDVDYGYTGSKVYLQPPQDGEDA